MKIIITRPQTDAAPFAALLQSRGVEAVLSPMMTIKLNDKQIPPDQSGQSLGALAFTSANGVRAYLGQSNRRKDLPVFAVGKETARLCGAEGFTNVFEADGDVNSLAALIAKNFRAPDANSFVGHIAGTERAGDLVALLDQQDIMSKRFVLYEAVSARALSQEAQKMMRATAAIGVTFFSPRTATLFYSMVATPPLSKTPLPPMTAYCLSDAVAAAVKTALVKIENPIDPVRILISKERTAASLATKIFNDLGK